MRFYAYFYINILFCTSKIAIKDFLDNCDWCKDQAKSTQPLDIGEWTLKCGQKPKDIWFTMKDLGRVYGTYKKSISRSWLYSKKLGWIYNAPSYKGYFYADRWGWIYIKDDMIYFFKDNRWDYLININS